MPLSFFKRARAHTSSRSVNATTKKGGFDPRLVGVQISSPWRTDAEPRPQRVKESEIAVDAQRRGIGGNYRTIK